VRSFTRHRLGRRAQNGDVVVQTQRSDSPLQSINSRLTPIDQGQDKIRTGLGDD
jgi:hypothetical protein